MARYTQAKNKLSRRIGEDLGLKTNSLKLARRMNITPGQHGAKGKRKVSDFGVQLKEKQKAKYIYGVMEKQLHALYVKASANPTATGSALLAFLERRLDNVIYRLGWAPTRAAARQLTSHAHVQVNGQKMSIPSYQVRVGDVITLKLKTTSIPIVAETMKKEVTVPVWLEAKGPAAKVVSLPKRTDITENINEQLIVEFYSR